MIKLILLLFYELLSFAIFGFLLLSFKSWYALLSLPVLVVVFLKLQDKPFQTIRDLFVYILKLVVKIIKSARIDAKKIITSKTNIQIVLLFLILLVVSLMFFAQFPMRLEWNYRRKLEQLRSANIPKETAISPSSSPIQLINDTGYVRILPVSIRSREKVSLIYGYKDISNTTPSKIALNPPG